MRHLDQLTGVGSVRVLELERLSETGGEARKVEASVTATVTHRTPAS